MKLKVEKAKDSKIFNARYKEYSTVFSSLIINTVDKYVDPELVIESGINSVRFDFGEELGRDYVKLEAEDDHDREILSRVRFLCAEKDQLWYVFLKVD